MRESRESLQRDPRRLVTRVLLADALRMLQRPQEASALFLELQDEKLLSALRESPAALTSRSGLCCGV